MANGNNKGFILPNYGFQISVPGGIQQSQFNADRQQPSSSYYIRNSFADRIGEEFSFSRKDGKPISQKEIDNLLAKNREQARRKEPSNNRMDID